MLGESRATRNTQAKHSRLQEGIASDKKSAEIPYQIPQAKTLAPTERR